MYVGVDIGGTKTLLAVLNERAEIVEQVKFPTPKNYDEFLAALEQSLTQLKNRDFQAGAVAVPGRLERDKGLVLELGNLPWHHEPIQRDCELLLGCPIIIENDAKLAALSEAMLHKDYSTVLYMTVSTGIGTGVVHNQKLDPSLQHSEGGHILLPHRGKLVTWESFASGKAIYEHFGKKAVDIPASDTKSWNYVARNIAAGLIELIAVLEPDLVVIGGSIGTYFDRYSDHLVSELKKHEMPLVPIPRIVAAERPEVAVVYGCYDIIKQVLPHAITTA